MIKEIIIVEGKNDISAVKRAVEAEVISTSGFGLNTEILKRIEKAYETNGIIIFTDPDYIGERIRLKLAKKFKNSKHAFLPLDQATKDADIGIENASPKNILLALEKARVMRVEPREEFTQKDLIKNKLVGVREASIRREALGEELGIGYTNAKQYLRRLNNYGVSREEFIKGLEEIENGRK